MIKVQNVRDEVKTRIDQFSSVLAQMQDGFIKNNLVQDEQIAGMRELLTKEMRDLKATNQLLEYELQRVQSLFRQLQTELFTTLEEKKAQNTAVL